MTREEDEPIWDRFYDQFRFLPSTHPENFPGIREPTPSVTYDVSDAFSGDEADLRAYELDLNLKTIQALRFCVSNQGRVCVLDWQHDCYWLDPHSSFNVHDPEAWAKPVLPNGDYYIFLSEDLQLGIFGHPWEQTMCVWGQALLEAFQQDLPRLFSRPIRRNGAAA